MGLRDDVRRFALTVESRSQKVFVGVTTQVQRSIQFGSEITNAPGQPVQTGRLRASWIGEFLDANRWQTSTNLPYALPIERGIGPHGPLTLRSSVGGFGSVALTVHGFQAIVRFVAENARRGGSSAGSGASGTGAGGEA